MIERLFCYLLFMYFHVMPSLLIKKELEVHKFLSNSINKKLSIDSSFFIFIVSFYFSFVLNSTLLYKIFNNLYSFDLESSLFVISIGIVLFIIQYIIFNCIVFPFIAKPLLILLLISSGFVHYAMYSYGIFIDKDMIRNIFETNAYESFEYVSLSGILHILFIIVLPILGIQFLDIRFKPFKQEICTRIKQIVIAIAVLLSVIVIQYRDYSVFVRNNRELRKLVNPLNYIYSTFRYLEERIKVKPQFVILDENVTKTVSPDSQKTVFVLILGETARSNNFSLYGYERQTNPLLSAQDLFVFRDVTSCGTSTAISVPCMFSHLGRGDFNVETAEYTENLMDLVKKAGYDVLWVENDNGCKGVCDRVQVKNTVLSDHQKDCFKDYCYDEVLLTELQNKLDNITTDTVIVLHMIGSHGPAYFRRYPSMFDVFKPTCNTVEIQNCSQNEILNTYDNTILYTDYIINQSIELLKKYPDYKSGLIYVSDHGESLGENNIYLHGFPYQIAPKEQKKVPMMLWVSDVMKKEKRIDFECLKKEAQEKAYTHDHLFHSILNLLQVKSMTYDSTLDLFHSCRIRSPV